MQALDPRRRSDVRPRRRTAGRTAAVVAPAALVLALAVASPAVASGTAPASPSPTPTAVPTTPATTPPITPPTTEPAPTAPVTEPTEPAEPEAPAAPAGDLASSDRPDFDGDGYADLAIGVENENLTLDRQGAVSVMYGTAAGLSPTGNQLWSQDSPGIHGTAEMNDRFGASLTWGDFDGDGYDDLAVGASGDRVNGVEDVGSVNVLYGSSTGLRATGTQLFNQVVAGMPGEPKQYDYFGGSVTARDFDGDGYTDLAVGAVGDGGDGDETKRDRGTVTVLYGSASGLRTNDALRFQQPNGKPKKHEWFGHALASADFDGDGFHDLAVGSPYASVGGTDQAGRVDVLYGSADGIRTNGSVLFHQGQSKIAADPRFAERFGMALTVGNFDGDGFIDLAVAIPYDAVTGIDGAGSAVVLYGSDQGLRGNGSQIWNQASAGIADAPEAEDNAGAVSSGDFDGDGYADLAIGYQGESVLGHNQAGAVNVIYGGADGLTSTGSQLWHQDMVDVVGEVAQSDYFGIALARADFDGDGTDDLAIGVAGDQTSASKGGGAVNVIYGDPTGMTAVGNQRWHQDVAGMLDTAEEPDFFGLTLMSR